jgi:hypothetical protein
VKGPFLGATSRGVLQTDVSSRHKTDWSRDQHPFSGARATAKSRHKLDALRCQLGRLPHEASDRALFDLWIGKPRVAVVNYLGVREHI